ncbi:Lrp/AsnC family transcriptional regulator [Ancylobacter dichloromethanicus]|uniref:Transcriptional regulator n=1 Tax=Ancylobacter dichloromethanicus TaxID=518825 RepID=A0A9W6J8Y3_9HYPH|nr:Lrp/AsnC family transcriptional regulator [Ancylobacter dichloromethanicus]MBS7554325.1 Lrp/AsnC family transcriptional regulator [Ancylobacter dichloromethanicus]GLK71450.1 transcriptional regulator [Ancylobacter dichloromethanicus]
MKLDATDHRILAALRRDGRITKLKLAEAVHLSPAACWERLRRLETAGIIKGYTAIIDLGAEAPRTTVIVEISLKSHQQADFRRFEEAVAREPAILACDATGGGIDYIMRVVVPDIDSYQRLIDRLLEPRIGIERYFSYVVTKSVPLARDGE